MYVRTKGIIIREVSYKENDKILTVLTDSLGKITVKGRGVKKIKTPLFNAANMFVYSEMTLFKKGDRYILDSAAVTEQFYGLRNDVYKLSLANYFAELCGRTTAEGVESGDILSLFLNSLYILSKTEKNLSVIKAAFEIKIMEYAGYKPFLEDCGCKSNDYYFDMEKGLLKCEKCIGKAPSRAFRLSPSVLSAMRYITLSDNKKLFSFTLPEKELSLLNKASEMFIKIQLDYEFQSLNYYKNLDIGM